MYRCVIFDVDGTLIDTEKAVIKSLQRLLWEEQGRNYKYEELFFALGVPGAISLEKLGIEDVESACAKWDCYMGSLFQEIKVYSGIRQTLEELTRLGVKTGIVTSKTKEQFKNDFLPFGLTDCLKCVVCADDTTNHKPHPEPLQKFLEIFQLEPQEALYVGDTIYDMRCAQGADVDFALALWGAKITEGIAAKYKLERPGEILTIASR